MAKLNNEYIFLWKKIMKILIMAKIKMIKIFMEKINMVKL
jgi:hypothetical protein